MTPEEAYRTASIADKRLPELEHIILTSSFYAYYYARDIIKGRWSAYTPYRAYDEASYCCKRLPELEDIILTDPRIAYYYARNIIKSRWEKAENVIMNHPLYCYCYAADVIKGKLPEKMHNMMILHAIKNSNDVWVKYYFERIK